MMRKTILAVAAAFGLLLGFGGSVPQAEAKPHIQFYFGSPYHGGYHGHGWGQRRHFGGFWGDRWYDDYPRYHRKRAPYHCHTVKRWRDGQRVRVKRCHRAWH
jgi:hypothetical protein